LTEPRQLPITLNFGGTMTIQSLAMGSFTGPWDNSANSNNITVSTSFGLSGAGSRSYNPGSTTYTITSSTGSWNFAGTSGATFNGSSSTIVFSGGTGTKTFTGGDKTYGTITLSPLRATVSM
jgi:hypothetical protein